MKGHQDGQGLEPRGERLREGGLLSLGRGWFRGHLPATCQCLRGGYGGDGARPFMLVCGGRARRSSGKLRREVQAGTRRDFAHEGGPAVQWGPWEVVQSPSFEVFKTKLGEAQSNPVWSQADRVLSRAGTGWAHMVASNLNYLRGL